MAWVSPRVYAILSKSEEGKDIIEQLPDMTQDECSQALDEFFGKGGKGYKSNAEYSQAKMDDETEERIYKEMGDEEVSEKDDEDDDEEEQYNQDNEVEKQKNDFEDFAKNHKNFEEALDLNRKMRKVLSKLDNGEKLSKEEVEEWGKMLIKSTDLEEEITKDYDYKIGASSMMTPSGLIIRMLEEEEK